ncbi:MAG: hypothetical protein WB947_01205 [Thermoplasmata archaeon]
MSQSLEAWAVELETRVRALERRLGENTSPQKAAVKPSPREFLLGKAPKSDSDKTLAAGYYLEIFSGGDSFDLDEIEDFYCQAKEAAPANRCDSPYQNVKKGYFREIGNRQAGMKARNRWALTNSGIARVENGFGNGARQ